MLSFKQFVMAQEPVSFTVEGYTVHVYFDPADAGLLLEGRNKIYSLGGQYTAQLHRAHSHVGQDHIHVYAKNGQIFALNRDGTAHDRSHNQRIPNKVAEAIPKYFPGFKIPPNNLIETASDEILSAFRRQILLG